MFTETPPESNTGLVLHRKDAKNAKKGKKPFGFKPKTGFKVLTLRPLRLE
jgi:hypothetical protein